MVKTAFFGHLGKKCFSSYFFVFQNQTFTFLIIKNKNLSSKIVKIAFFGHFGAKNNVPGPNFYLSCLIVSINRTQT